MARRTLARVNAPVRRRSVNGRSEAWHFTTEDGLWAGHRLEMPGSPWELEHRPTGTFTDWYGDQDAARAAIADGTAMANVSRQLDHVAGKHAERDPACRKCI